MTTETVLLDPDTADPDGRERRTVPLAETIVIRLPKRFYDDHRDRDLIAGNVEAETASHYLVRLDRVAFLELESDARLLGFYSAAGEYGPEYLGLVSSARATVRRLEAARPEGWSDDYREFLETL